jgi:hypothetical protein
VLCTEFGCVARDVISSEAERGVSKSSPALVRTSLSGIQASLLQQTRLVQLPAEVALLWQRQVKSLTGLESSAAFASLASSAPLHLCPVDQCHSAFIH